jgi:hypothetical protein
MHDVVAVVDTVTPWCDEWQAAVAVVCVGIVYAADQLQAVV